MYHYKLPKLYLFIISLLVCAGTGLTLAADAPSKPDEQLAASITVGKAQWLEAGGERFLGIYTPALSGSPAGARSSPRLAGCHRPTAYRLAKLRLEYAIYRTADSQPR